MCCLLLSWISVYIYRSQETQRPAAAISWQALEEGYQAYRGKDTLLYGETLEKLKAMENQPIKLLGYMLPLEAGEKHQHFLLSSRNHTCPFCMPANAGNLVEVTTVDAIDYQHEPVTIRGEFTIEQSQDSDLIYHLNHAVLTKK
jgi:hypothetical protein